MDLARNGHKNLASSERKATGAHYTPVALASFVARQIVQALQTPDDSSSIRISQGFRNAFLDSFGSGSQWKPGQV
jgi:hypothetical protein